MVKKQSQVFTDLEKNAFENVVGTRRKLWQPAFSPFPLMLPTLPGQISSFEPHSGASSAFNFDKSTMYS